MAQPVEIPPRSARRQASRLRRAVLALAMTLTAFALAPIGAQARFDLGLQDTGFQLPPASPNAQAAYRALGAIHGSTVRLVLAWSAVAPGGATRPKGLNAADPADPQYNWSATDLELRIAAQRHERVVLNISYAPEWAQPPDRPASLKKFPAPWNPSAAEFAQFARAAALRYDGRFADPLHPGAHLPRVQDWEIWNEENLPYDLAAPNLVEEYRSLLNAGYGSIKAVHADNVVAVGGLAPVSFAPPLSISPLKFAADLMCLRRVGATFVRNSSCPHPAHFDVLAMHPYTLAATPTKHAYHYDDVLIGDIGKINSVVRAADTLHTIAPRSRHRIWVTEWSWFTNPPNKTVGDSYSTAARYTAYSMYEMWHSGVSLIIWFTARDPQQTSRDSPNFVNGGALYSSAGRPKPTLQAFAFPVVASVAHGRGFVWGRAPVSQAVRVVVERASGRGWKQIANVRTGADGIFLTRFQAGTNGRYRARVEHGPVSLAYDSTPIPPRRTHLFYSG
ncbi:MAG: hypothetical protein ACR2IP_10165 [Solirubrobacteraceae bacterium]